MKFCFLTDSQLLVKCRGPLRTAPALHKLTEVQTFCVQPEVLASRRSSGFQMFRGRERWEQLLISRHKECFSQSCHSRLFISSHFLSVYLWFEPVDWRFSLYWENSYLPRVRERAESRVTNRSEGMFVSASLFLGARDGVAIHEIFIVLATSGHPCSWREGMVWESKIA